jgi:hypothetical protein
MSEEIFKRTKRTTGTEPMSNLDYKARLEKKLEVREKELEDAVERNYRTPEERTSALLWANKKIFECKEALRELKDEMDEEAKLKKINELNDHLKDLADDIEGLKGQAKNIALLEEETPKESLENVKEFFFGQTENYCEDAEGQKREAKHIVLTEEEHLVEIERLRQELKQSYEEKARMRNNFEEKLERQKRELERKFQLERCHIYESLQSIQGIIEEIRVCLRRDV